MKSLILAIILTCTLQAQNAAPRHRLIVCLSTLRKVIAVNPTDSKYSVLAESFEGKKFNSPNDVVLGPDGALYFTDPNIDLPKNETQELPY